MKTTYKIDPAHSSAQFTVRHMMISNVRGSFGSVQGTIEYDADHPEQSQVTAEIDVNSISTTDEKRDGHLKSPDFLDAANHPTITTPGKDSWWIVTLLLSRWPGGWFVGAAAS